MPKTHVNVDLGNFEILDKLGFYFIHANISSILPKIEEIIHIAHSKNLSILVISESKLDSFVNDNEIRIPGYDLLEKIEIEMKEGF